MRKRSRIPDTDEAVAALSITELNAEINRWAFGFRTSGTSQGRKAFFKRLVRLESLREKFHNIPAPKRDFRQR
jgi:hypothetical protein